MEIAIVVGVLFGVGFGLGLTVVWQRQSKLEERQAAIEARQAAIELEMGHGAAHDAARGMTATDLRKDKTVLGRLRAVELFVLVNRRGRSR